MAKIARDRVVSAAAGINAVELGARVRHPLQNFLLLKALGASTAGEVKLTAQDVVGPCDQLFRVEGRPPSYWYEPLTGVWGTMQPNGGWPIGTVWTQMTRQSQALRDMVLLSRPAEDNEPTGFSLRNDYLARLSEKMKGQKLSAIDWSIWFARNRDDLPSPIHAEELFRDLAEYLHLSDDEINVIFGEPPGDVEIPIETDPDPPLIATLLPTDEKPTPGDMPEDPAQRDATQEVSYNWTSAYSLIPLPEADVRALVERTLDFVEQANLVLPQADRLIERCVIGLLTGHLILQGPPGTGKTTLAQLLARAFDAEFDLRTATSDWTTYDVIGGLRPTSDNQLAPILGCIPESVLKCAQLIRRCEEAGPDSADATKVAHWLIIDEFNRADIDRAIGGLYTVFSSTSPAHLSRMPIELWFEEEPRRRLWMPARFRLIGAMNDVDTSFVNALSQGLTRRFQFVYVGIPEAGQTATESQLARQQAREWIESQYGNSAGDSLSASDFNQLTSTVSKVLESLTLWLRYNEEDGKRAVGWPLGTAQIVDLWKTICLHVYSRPGISDSELLQSFDLSFADRVIPQMGTLRTAQLSAFLRYLRDVHPDLTETARAVEHLANPQSVR